MDGLEGRLLRNGCEGVMRYIQSKGLLIVIAYGDEAPDLSPGASLSIN